MATDGIRETGWRGSREGWLDAARTVFAERGLDAVTIQTVSARLNLSRTSFYWHFKDRDALLLALMDLWQARTTAPLIAASRAFAGSRSEAMLKVIGCFMDETAFDTPLETAIRSAALRDDRIMDRLRAADAERLSALCDLMLRWGYDPAEADVRARTIYLAQIGYIAMQQPDDMPTRLQRVPAYVHIYIGSAPTPDELARFMGEHRFASRPTGP